MACYGGFATICSTLITEGKADVQDRSPVTGFVALHIAALKGYDDCLKVLLELGAPLHPRSTEGDTPRDLAIKYDHLHIAEIIDNYPVQPPKTLPRMWLHENLGRQVSVFCLCSCFLPHDNLIFLKIFHYKALLDDIGQDIADFFVLSRQHTYILNFCYC